MAKRYSVVRVAHEGLETLVGTASLSAAPGTSLPFREGEEFDAARFENIAAIATDRSGNTYVADVLDQEAGTLAIRFVNRSQSPVTFYANTVFERTVASGTVGTIAGLADESTSAPGGPLVGEAPALAVVDNRLYLATSQLQARHVSTVRLMNLTGGELAAHGKVLGAAAMQEIVTVAGNSTSRAGSRSLAAPVAGIASDNAGSLFYADSGGNRIRQIDSAGAVTTVAGTGAPGFNGNDRPAVTARLNRPYDVDVGPDGRLYISDAGNSQIRFVDTAGLIHSALGNGAAAQWTCVSDRNGAAGGPSVPRTGSVNGLAADSVGNLYIANSALGQIHRVTLSGDVRPYAGSPQASCPPTRCVVTEGAPVRSAHLVAPTALATRPGGGLFMQEGLLATPGQGRIRFLNTTPRSLRVHGVVVAPGTVRTVVGSEGPDAGIDADGRALDARIGLRDASGALVADRTGNLFLIDRDPPGPISGGRLRQVDPAGNITTLFQLPADGLINGEVDTTRCCGLVGGIALDGRDNLYISGSQRVWFFNRGTTTVVAHGVAVAPGAVEPVAGSVTGDSVQDGSRALDAALQNPENLALDLLGNLYVLITPEHMVRRVDTAGTIATVVGTGQRGFGGEGLKGRLTSLDRPIDIAVDACGNLLIADLGNDRVRRLNLVKSCAVTKAAADGKSRSSPLTTTRGLVLLGTVLGVACWSRKRLLRRERTA